MPRCYASTLLDVIDIDDVRQRRTIEDAVAAHCLDFAPKRALCAVNGLTPSGVD